MLVIVEIEMLCQVSAGNAPNYYNDIIKHALITGGTVMGGPGGGIATTIGIYGIEGFVQVVPEAIQALEQMNRLTDAQVKVITENPYSYAD